MRPRDSHSDGHTTTCRRLLCYIIILFYLIDRLLVDARDSLLTPIDSHHHQEMTLDVTSFIDSKGGNSEEIRESQRKRGHSVEVVDEVIQMYQDWVKRMSNPYLEDFCLLIACLKLTLRLMA